MLPTDPLIDLLTESLFEEIIIRQAKRVKPEFDTDDESPDEERATEGNDEN